MHTRPQRAALPIVTAFCLALAGALAVAAPDGAHHHHHHGDATGLALDNGRKWAIDAPLSRAMGSIRAAMQADIAAIHEDRLPPGGYAALAGTITDEVAYMIANCRLEPAADAQLHLIIADLLEGAATMEGKAGPASPRDGARKVLGALENYAAFFDDAEFEPVRH